MKIDPVNLIRIAGHGGAADALRRLDVGGEISARVVERQGRNTALLEIGGGRIRAEFTRGLPAGDSLALRLDGIRNGSYVFSMIGSGGRADFLAQLLRFSLVEPGDVGKFNPAEIGRLLASRGDALYQLHAYLLQARQRGRGDRDAGMLLARLFSLGLGAGARSDLAFLLTDRALGSTFAALLYGLIGRDRGMSRDGWKGPAVGNLAADLEMALDSVASDAGRQDLVEFLVEALAAAPGESPEKGVVPLYGDDGFVPARYVRAGDFVHLNLELSALGQLDIVARSRKPVMRIMIIPEREESCAFIREFVPGLYERFGSSGMRVDVTVHNRHGIIDKMVEINSYFSLNSEFDIKV